MKMVKILAIPAGMLLSGCRQEAATPLEAILAISAAAVVVLVGFCLLAYLTRPKNDGDDE